MPDTPPTELGTIQLYPPALTTAAVEKRYCLAPHVLLNKVCVMAVGVAGIPPESVTVKVTVESHDALLVRFAVYVPAALIFCPFQLYGNWLLHNVMLEELEVLLLIVRFKVTIESHPDALVPVHVYTPLVV
jgi:hypothetical protein